MKKYTKLHENEKVAHEHISKINARGGNVEKSIKNGKILLEYSFQTEKYTTLAFKTKQIAETNLKEIKEYFGDKLLKSEILFGKDERGNRGYKVIYFIKK